jgi:hypothetical protein
MINNNNKEINFLLDKVFYTLRRFSEVWKLDIWYYRKNGYSNINEYLVEMLKYATSELLDNWDYDYIRWQAYSVHCIKNFWD